MGRIFISHRNTPADNAWAAKIHRWIKDEKGINGFLDFDVQDGLQIGEKWEDAIYAAMNAAQVVIAIVSKAWLASDWCLSEARMARLLGLKLILIIIEDCPFPFPDTQSIRLDLHGEDKAFEELRQALRNNHKLPDRPYPGLAAFDERDAAVFFGRENETHDLVNKVYSLFQGRPATARLLLVQGASGSGKSSLMRAGFLPQFKEDPENLCVGPIIPHGDALDELAEVLDCPVDRLDPDSCADAIIAALKRLKPDYKRAVICVDQAEELLAEDAAFFDVMRAVLEKRRGRVIVLATIRSDYLNEFQTRRLIGEEAKLKYATVELDALPKDYLSAIIRQPAQLFGVDYEDDLFTRICEDHGGPDALPLLAFFLSEFWQDQYINDGVLKLPEYKDSGGIQRALMKAVQEAIELCKTVQPVEHDAQKLRDELRELFLGRLVALRGGSDNAVRRHARADGLTDRQVALLKVFASKRLLIEDRGEWQVVHEALLRQWADLKNWIAEAREDLIAIDRIEAAAAHWQDAGRQEADLIHSGNRLAEAMRIWHNKRYAERFDETEKAYITACQKKENDRYEQEKALREAAEHERDAARKNLRLGLAALSSVELQAGRPAEALYLGLAAWPRQPDPAVDLSDYHVVLRALQTAGIYHRELVRIIARDKRVSCLAFSPDGKLIVTGGDSNTLQLWDAETGDPVGAPMTGHEHVEEFGRTWGNINCVAFSPDGTRIVSGGADLVFRLWDAQTGAQIGVPMKSDEGSVLGSVGVVAFSPDGTQIASCGYHDAIRLWDAKTGAQIGEPLILDPEMAQELKAYETFGESLAFSPNGTRMAIGYRDGTIVRWNLKSRLPYEGAIRTSGKVVGVSFSKDGARILSVSAEGLVAVWDAVSGKKINEWKTPGDGSLTKFAFSSDRTRIAIDGHKGLSLWDPESGVPVIDAPLLGHETDASAYSYLWNGLAFSPDGTRLASGGDDATIRLWDIRTGLQIGAPVMQHEKVSCVRISIDGNEIISGGTDKKLQRWDVQNATLVGQLEVAHDATVTDFAISPDGTRIASGAEDGTVGLWCAKTGTPIGAPRATQDGLVHCVVFSPDGTRVVSWDDTNTLQLWDSQTGNPVGAAIKGKDQDATAEQHPQLFDLRVAFSPNGGQMISGGTDGSIRLWDAETGERIGQFMGENDTQIFSAVAISPDGSFVVGGCSDGTLRRWCTQTGARIGEPMIRHSEQVSSLIFSHGRTRLVSGDVDGIILLWDLATGCCISRMAGHAGRVCSLAFFPDDARIVSGGSDGTVRLWDVDYGSGNLFEVLCRRMPTRNPPSILATYGIELDEPICSGEEPLPSFFPMKLEP